VNKSAAIFRCSVMVVVAVWRWKIGRSGQWWSTVVVGRCWMKLFVRGKFGWVGFDFVFWIL